jgi:hypothetical protein
MNISVEPVPSIKITEENDRLAQTQGHCSFNVFAKAIAGPGIVYKKLRALHHQALDQTLILMADRGTSCRVKIP